jgi:hypothetical protein
MMVGLLFEGIIASDYIRKSKDVSRTDDKCTVLTEAIAIELRARNVVKERPHLTHRNAAGVASPIVLLKIVNSIKGKINQHGVACSFIDHSTIDTKALLLELVIPRHERHRSSPQASILFGVALYTSLTLRGLS